MTRLVTTARAAQSAGRPLQPPGCYASLTRPPTAALDPGASTDPAPGSPRGRSPPAPTHAPTELTPNPGRPWTTPPTFPSPNVKQHPGLKRQASGGTRHIKSAHRPECPFWELRIVPVAYMPGLALRRTELSAVAAPGQARHLLVVRVLGDLGATETKTETSCTRRSSGDHRPAFVLVAGGGCGI